MAQDAQAKRLLFGHLAQHSNEIITTLCAIASRTRRPTLSHHLITSTHALLPLAAFVLITSPSSLYTKPPASVSPLRMAFPPKRMTKTKATEKKIHSIHPKASAATSWLQYAMSSLPQRLPPPNAEVYEAMAASQRIQLKRERQLHLGGNARRGRIERGGRVARF